MMIKSSIFFSNVALMISKTFSLIIHHCSKWLTRSFRLSYINGLVHDCSISSALEILQSCTDPSIWGIGIAWRINNVANPLMEAVLECPGCIVITCSLCWQSASMSNCRMAPPPGQSVPIRSVTNADCLPHLHTLSCFVFTLTDWTWRSDVINTLRLRQASCTQYCWIYCPKWKWLKFHYNFIEMCSRGFNW